MKNSKRPSKLSIITLSITYLIICTFLFLVFDKIISNIDFIIQISPAIYLLAIILPILFIIIITIKIFQIYTDKKSNKSSAKFKSKIIMYFTIITILGMIPQSGLALLFIQNTAQTWLPDDTIPTLELGYEAAFENYNQKLSRIDNLCQNETFIKLFDKTNFNNSQSKETLWDEINMIEESIISVQIYNRNTEVAILGNKDYKQKNYTSKIGNLGKESISEKDIYRYHQKIDTNYSFILTSDISSKFATLGKPISNSLKYYKKLEGYKNDIPRFMLIMFCMIFVPILFIILLLSLYLTEEITRPITSIEEASRNVADGDFSIRIIEKEESDFNTVINSFNTMISELERKNEIKGEHNKLDNSNFTEVKLSDLLSDTKANMNIDDDTVLGDAKLLTSLFNNLIRNSIESSDENAVIDISIDRIRKNDSVYKRVIIKDTGSGIAENIQSKVFLPYFTTKNSSNGNGLALAEKIVLLHKGSIRFESVENIGTTFYVDLPAKS